MPITQVTKARRSVVVRAGGASLLERSTLNPCGRFERTLEPIPDSTLKQTGSLRFR